MKLIPAAFRLFILIALLADGHAFVVRAQEPTFTVQTNHSTSVTSVCFSRDGRFMLTGSFNGEFKLWEAATRRELRSFRGRATGPFALTTSTDISPDGKTVALAASGVVSLWDAATGREVRSVATGVKGLSVLWDAGGHLFVRSRKQIAVYDIARGRLVARLEKASEGFAVTPDGSRVAVRGGAEIWGVATNSRIAVRAPRGNSFTAVAFSPDGRSLLTGDDTGAIRVHDAATGVEQSIFAEAKQPAAPRADDPLASLMAGKERNVKAITFSPRGDLLARLTVDGEINVRRWPTGEQVIAVKGHDSPEARVFLSHAFLESVMRFTPDGDYLAACRGSNAVEFFNLRGKAGPPARPLEVESFGASLKNIMKFVGPGRLYALPGGPAVHFSAGGRWLAMLGAAPFLMSLGSGEVTPGRKRTEEMLVKLSPDEATGVTLYSRRELRLFNFDTEESTPLGILPDESLLSDVSADGRHMLSASFTAGEVRLWDLRERKVSGAWRLPADEIPILGNINSPALLSPDGKIFISQAGDGTVTLRDARSGRVVNAIKAYVPAYRGTLIGGFSPDGRVLALSANGKPVELWEVASGRKLKTLRASAEPTERTVCLSFGPDGKSLYGSDLRFRVWAWEVEAAKGLPL